MTRIPFLDVRAGYLEIKPEIDEAIERVLSRGQYILGDEVEAFENAFAAYCGSRHAIGVGNGLDALHLSLLALGVTPGDEVIVPSHTFIATWLAVSHCGAIPIPVEPKQGTYNIDPMRIEEAISSRTKVILPVHLYGQPVDLDPILMIADKYGVHVLEDAAQAHGARYCGRRIGSHGAAVAWSFYPSKNLGAFGDAGAVTTNDATLAERLRILRNYGSRSKYVTEVQGFNSRLSPLQAATLRVKLLHLDDWNYRRTLVAKRYLHSLSGAGLLLPQSCNRTEPVWHLFVVQHAQRDSLRSRLAKQGVESLIHYPIPPHQQGVYRRPECNAMSLPIATKLAQQVLSLPIGPHLSHSDVTQVIEATLDAAAAITT